MIRDPVNDFEIPEEWIERSKIPKKELVEGIESGRMLLLSDGCVLKRGLTTGTTAAAAAKGAVISLFRDLGDANKHMRISVPTPIGIRAHMGVQVKGKIDGSGVGVAIKEGGDHESDITAGIEIIAKARPLSSTPSSPPPSDTHNTITITTGGGIGTVTREGLKAHKGEAAINPAALAQIKQAVQEARDEAGMDNMGGKMAGEVGIEVELSVTDGEKIAAETLNPRIGVVGGISILGTTGFVEPWNDHLGDMKWELVRKSRRVVLTTGRIGMKYSTMLFPHYDVVMVGSRIDEGVKNATGEVIVCGLPGLVLKWGDPKILVDTDFALVQEMIEMAPEHPNIEKALHAAHEKCGGRVVVIDRAGTILLDTGEQSDSIN